MPDYSKKIQIVYLGYLCKGSELGDDGLKTETFRMQPFVAENNSQAKEHI